MSFPNFVLGTIHETYSFRKTLDDVLSDLAKKQSAPIARAIRGMLSFSGAAKGVLGSFHYDITQSSYNRLESEVISAEALLIASKCDDFIDENKMPQGQKIEIVYDLLDVVKKGIIHTNQSTEVKALSIVARDLHTRITKSPYPDFFFSEYTSLADAVISQLNGECSLEIAEKTGGGTMAVSAIIPYCYNPALPDRFLKAAKKFGGYFQVLDDIWDFEHDKRKKINTAMTTAQNPDGMKAVAKKYASRLYDECLVQLNSTEQQMYRALNVLFHIKWFVERYVNG